MAPTELRQRLLERLRRKPTWFGVLVVVIVVASLVGGYRAHHYVSRESNYCAACHSSAARAVHQHAHNGIACQNCHASSFASGVNLTLRSIVGANVSRVKHGETSAKLCQSCHLDPKSKRPISGTSGHVAHVINKPNLECKNCHELRDHGTQVDESACARCHSTLTMHDSGMVRVTCLSCHNFTSPPTAKGSIPATGCPKCHGGRQLAADDPERALQSQRVISAEVTHGNVNACRLCHDPHAAEAKSRRSGMDCDRCHKGIGTQVQTAAVAGHPGCATCHQIHGPRPQTPGLCAQCHGKKLASNECAYVVEQASRLLDLPQAAYLQNYPRRLCRVPQARRGNARGLDGDAPFRLLDLSPWPFRSQARGKLRQLSQRKASPWAP